MRVARWKRLGSRSTSGAAVAAVVAFILASCAPTVPAALPGAARVIPLHQISTLKSLFNRDRGHPRLVLILSPT